MLFVSGLVIVILILASFNLVCKIVILVVELVWLFNVGGNGIICDEL